MGNLHHQGYGSSSLWGLYNKHKNYNWNDGADDCIFTVKLSISSFTYNAFLFDISTVKRTKWTDYLLDKAEWIESKLSVAMKHALLTCICSS